MIDRSLVTLLSLALAVAGCGASPAPGMLPDPTSGAGPEAVQAPVKIEPPPKVPAAGAHEVSVPAAAALSDMASAMVAAHNKDRAQHCAPPLTWSPELAAVAQKWADHLRDHGCGFDHSNTNYGENLAMGTSGSLDPAAVVAMWYDEVAKYDFAHGAFGMDTGHFTQVVWRGTTKVGCGKSTCNGNDIWVCNYDPAGNVDDEFRDNVKPKGCK